LSRHRNQNRPGLPSQQEQQHQLQIRHEQHQYVGPLPPPEQLAAFDHVLPGLADRITKMPEGRALNRWRNERTIRVVAILGQVFAFIVAMTISLGGIYLTVNGHPVTGLAALFGTVAGILYAIRQVRTKQAPKQS
jgi:uncharacterized membrane protein